MTRVLVVGVGNIFLGDDGFGVEVARRLASRNLPGVERASTSARVTSWAPTSFWVMICFMVSASSRP